MPKHKSTEVTQNRGTLYPDIDVRCCTGNDALTPSQARDLLGWVEETEKEPFGADYLLKDKQGKKIRCYNNMDNRPLYQSNVSSIEQEICRDRYRFNGEPIIIGETGKVLNGQHTLIALILADQEHPDGSYVIDKLVVFGVSEDDEVVNTMDTCKPRTLMDVLFRSDVFKDVDKRERKTIARTCSFAINTVWDRTGAANAFAPRQTHSEAVDFLQKHPRLLEAVEFIHNENVEGSIASILSPGYAAGLMYLMSCAQSDPEEYQQFPCEESLNFDNWDRACDFFIDLSSGSKKLEIVKKKLVRMMHSEDGITRAERFALVVTAWKSYLSNKKVTNLKLNYRDVEGIPTLEDPNVGGIDLCGGEL